MNRMLNLIILPALIIQLTGLIALGAVDWELLNTIKYPGLRWMLSFPQR